MFQYWGKSPDSHCWDNYPEVKSLQLIWRSGPVDEIYGGSIFKLVAVTWLNTLRPKQNGRHFPDDTFKCIFLNENVRISIKIDVCS